MKKFFVFLFITTLLSSCADKSVYMFSYFMGGGDGLHYAYSYDGHNWTAVKNGEILLTPVVGEDKLMRDPSILQGPDGTFHMVWTSSWTDKIIGYASSKDLVNWSEQRAIPVMTHEEGARNSWAPELYYDHKSKLFYILWSTNIAGRYPSQSAGREGVFDNKIYYTTTTDFVNFSPTQLYFNPDFNVIDAAIVYDEKQEDYVMVVKNENQYPPEKNIRITRSEDIANGFPVEVSEPITGDYWAEGASPIFIGDYLYVYFDKYTNHKYGAVRSLDGETWEDISDQITFPEGVRHGTVFKVKQKVLNEVLKAFEGAEK